MFQYRWSDHDRFNGAPPRSGQPSYQLYASERDTILSSLKRRAQKLSRALNELPGMSCNPCDGAMYAFPQVS